MFHVPESYRFCGSLYSDESYGNNGQFRFASPEGGRMLFCQVSDGSAFPHVDDYQWEHVSVHAYTIIRGKRGKPSKAKTYTPTWVEMCFVKAMFWDADDVVIQYHPRESDYVNQHPNVLHLWRPTKAEIPVPPPILVGLKDVQPETQSPAPHLADADDTKFLPRLKSGVSFGGNG